VDTVTITMDIPKDMLLAADIPTSNAQAGIRKYLALYMFKERILSFGKATELSGMDKLTFMELAGSKRIPLNYDVNAYHEDLKTIEDLGL